MVNKFLDDGNYRLWVIDDNAKPQRIRAVNTWMEANEVERWFQSPYSPDLLPCDYGLFHPLKRAIGGVAYPNIQTLVEAINIEIQSSLYSEKYTAVRKLPERWQRCIHSKS